MRGADSFRALHTVKRSELLRDIVALFGEEQLMIGGVTRLGIRSKRGEDLTCIQSRWIPEVVAVLAPCRRTEIAVPAVSQRHIVQWVRIIFNGRNLQIGDTHFIRLLGHGSGFGC